MTHSTSIRHVDSLDVWIVERDGRPVARYAEQHTAEIVAAHLEHDEERRAA